MDGFTRYVLRQLLVGMVLVTVALTCVFWLTQSLRFIEMIVNRGLTAGAFLRLTMLLLPNFLPVILPIAAFSVVLFTYSRMVSDRELVVMRAAGVSQLALAKPALILSALVVLLGYAFNLYIVPESYKAFRVLQWDIRYSYSHILLNEGSFNTVAAGITVYVRERASDGQLKGILVHDRRDPDKPFTLMAERGAMIDAEDGARVVMFNGNRQHVDKATNRLSILYFERYTFDLETRRGAAPARYREARERDLDELFDPGKDPTLSRTDYGKFKVEGHRRLVSPWYCLAYIMIGLACLISGSFSRRTQSRRVVLAVVTVVAVQVAMLGLDNVSAKENDWIPLMYVNVLVPILAGFAITLRPPRRRVAPAPTAVAGT